jgi:hypothetical protein
MTSSDPAEEQPAPRRRSVLLRIDPAVHDALTRWAADDLRSLNAQIEILLRDALRRAGRAPAKLAPLRPRGRPRASSAEDGPDS